MSNTEEIKAKALDIIENAKELWVTIDELKEWDSFTEIMNNISKIVTFVTGVVVAVENVVTEFFDENVTSDEKLEAAAQICDDLIKGNIWLEIIDKSLFKIVISVVVHFINDKYGKLWKLEVK